MHKTGWQLCCVALGAMWLAGCAFNIIAIRQEPAHFEATAGAKITWDLLAPVKVTLVEGFAAPLKSGTHWTKTGQIAQGEVFHTADQVVVVEASHEHEADIVVRDGKIVGFFLRVEGTFTPAAQPTDIKTSAR